MRLPTFLPDAGGEDNVGLQAERVEASSTPTRWEKKGGTDLTPALSSKEREILFLYLDRAVSEVLHEQE